MLLQMALNLRTTSTLQQRPFTQFNVPNQKKHALKLYDVPSSSSFSRFASVSQGTESKASVEEVEDSSAFSGSSPSSARIQLDLLQRLSSSNPSVDGYQSDDGSFRPTIREQLANLFGDREGDFLIPLGKDLKKVTAKFLTTSQKRNIRRQAYLNEVSQRNDSVFFATIGAFVIIPPIAILGVAIATGYVQLFP